MKTTLYVAALLVSITAIITVGVFFAISPNTTNTSASTSSSTFTVTNNPGGGPETPGVCGASKIISADGLSLRISESASVNLGSRVCIDVILTNNRTVSIVPGPIFYNITDSGGNVMYSNLCETYPPIGQPNTLAPTKYVECTDFWNTQQASTTLSPGLYHLSVSYVDSATNTTLTGTADLQLNPS